MCRRDENSVRGRSPAGDERQLTESGYPREVWLVERGKSFEESPPVLSNCRRRHDGKRVALPRSAGGRRLI